MRRTDPLKKTLMLGKTEGRRGQQRMTWLDDITDLMDLSLSKLQELVMCYSPWSHKSRTRLSHWNGVATCTPSCLLNVPMWKFHKCQKLYLPTTEFISFMFPFPVFLIILISSTSTQLLRPETWLFSPHYFWHLAKSCQISPLHFSNLLSPPCPVTELRPVSSLTWHTTVSSPTSLQGSQNFPLMPLRSGHSPA